MIQGGLENSRVLGQLPIRTFAHAYYVRCSRFVPEPGDDRPVVHFNRAIIDLLHSPLADLEVISTTNPALLSSSSPPREEFVASYRDIVETLKGYLVAAEEGKFHVSEKVKAFWRTKLASHEELLQVLEPIDNEELKKQYLEKACSYLIAFRPSVMVRTTRVCVCVCVVLFILPGRNCNYWYK